MIYQFGRFVLDTERYVLSVDAAPLEVEPRVFELLHHLVASEGRIVTKEELIAAVWRGRFVSDAAVVRAVQKARRLIDDEDEPSWIAAVYGRGYRFTGEVSIRGGEATDPPRPATHAPVAKGGAESIEPRPAESRVPVRPGVAVLPLSNLSGRSEHGWIGAALAELLAAELAADGGARVVPQSLVAELARDFPSLQGTAVIDRRTLDAVRSLLGAELLVTGSFLAAVGEQGDGLRVNLALRAARGSAPAGDRRRPRLRRRVAGVAPDPRLARVGAALHRRAHDPSRRRSARGTGAARGGGRRGSGLRAGTCGAGRGPA